MLRPYVTGLANKQVRVPNPRFAEDAATAVTGRPRLGAGGRLEVVYEGAHDAALHQSRRGGGHTFVIEGTRCRAVGRQRIVTDREARVEYLLADSGGERRAALQHGLTGEGLLDRQDDGGEAPRREHDRQRAIRW